MSISLICWRSCDADGSLFLGPFLFCSTDTLEHFPHLKTLIATIRAAQGEEGPHNKVVSMLTGDFLSPYLLSSVDLGAGMMNALAATPIDYLTWGNHGMCDSDSLSLFILLFILSNNVSYFFRGRH